MMRLASLLPVALFMLTVAVPSARADGCKQAGPLPQSKCTKDSQCCPGLVCQAAGPSKNNATTQCLPGCRIGGAFQTPGQKNTAPNNCQSCQPSVSATAWTNVAAGTSCRASAGECDLADTCTGTSATCPDTKKSAGTGCTSDGNPCTLDHCDGSSVTCQHPAGNAGATCRAAAGVCDTAETCDGSSNACPADTFQASTVECRSSTGDCDVAENCTGASPTCPADAPAPDGTSCDNGGGMCAAGVCETTTTTTTPTTTTTTTTNTIPTCTFECPPVDLAARPLIDHSTGTTDLFCRYQVVPNDFFCKYFLNTGLLKQDNDQGFCPPVAIPNCST